MATILNLADSKAHLAAAAEQMTHIDIDNRIGINDGLLELIAAGKVVAVLHSNGVTTFHNANSRTAQRARQ